MSGELAGRLQRRVILQRRDPARDPIGGAGGGWSPMATLWAAIELAGGGGDVMGEVLAAPARWRVTLRAGADATIGDRLVWGARRLAVRNRLDDPAEADRIILICEEERQ